MTAFWEHTHERAAIGSRGLKRGSRLPITGKLFIDGDWADCHHRSGWPFAIQSLKLLHSDSGVLVDTFLEKKFAWGRDLGDRLNQFEPYTEPWVGFLHNPPMVPEWFNLNGHSPHDILNFEGFKQSLPFCVGIFTLSDYLSEWLGSKISVPVCAVKHPTEPALRLFEPERYFASSPPSLVHVGWWLRRVHSFYELNPKKHHKVLLRLKDPWVSEIFKTEIALSKRPIAESRVEHVDYLSNDEYDDLLTRSIVFLDLYDSSANNAIIECIARGTPILVPPLKAVIEYLGTDYPLYFSSLNEAVAKLECDGLILAAHEHLLKSQIREELSAESFVRQVAQSKILLSLQARLPKVSIITSLHCADDFIHEFLANIVDQTVFDQCELLLYNVSSSHVFPETVLGTIKEFQLKFDNIKCVDVFNDPGLYGVWNAAIKSAKGMYITNANVDDRRAPNHIEALLATLESNPGVDLACSAILGTKDVVPSWGTSSTTRLYSQGFNWQAQEHSSLDSPTLFGFEDLFFHDSDGARIDSDNIPHCMPLWRKNLHDRFGLFDEAGSGPLADWAFWLKCSAGGSVFYRLPKILGLYSERADSYGRRTDSDEIKSLLIRNYGKEAST